MAKAFVRKKGTFISGNRFMERDIGMVLILVVVIQGCAYLMVSKIESIQ